MIIRNWVKRLITLKKNKTVKLSRGAVVSIDTTFEGYNCIGSESYFSGHLGECSYIGKNCHIRADIGKYCSIASFVHTVSGVHPTKSWVSTHPSFFSIRKQCGITYVSEPRFQEDTSPVKIGNDVWIAHGAILLDGIQIGDGAVIAAGAVVTKDVAPYTVVGGVPAAVIKKRFTDEQISFLIDFQWWNRDRKWIEENAMYFDDIEKLINRYAGNIGGCKLNEGL